MAIQLNPVIGTLGSATISAPFQPGANQPFNIFIYGTFVATVAIVRSLDGGASWLPLSNAAQTGALAPTAPMSYVQSEPDAAVLYALSTQVANGGAYTSGTVSYRIG